LRAVVVGSAEPVKSKNRGSIFIKQLNGHPSAGLPVRAGWRPDPVDDPVGDLKITHRD
jgi:hypothetical protein